MKKILFIRQNAPGGTDRYCHMIYNLFSNDDEFEPLPIKNYPTIKIPILHYYYTKQKLKEAISNADIIHINGYTALGTVQSIIMAHKLGKKIVYSPHWHPFKYLHFPLISKIVFYSFFYFVIKKYVDVVTTINNEDTAFMKRIHPHVIQIPHCLERKYNIPQQKRNPKMILFVGGVKNRVKGFEHLLHLPENIYEIHCVGKGKMPNRKDFYQHVGVSDEELAKLYSQASLTVIPSRYEAFCYVALEALYQGSPVLLSDRVRIADYLNGIKGFGIFKYNNYNSFCKKVKECIDTQVDVEKIKSIFSQQRIKMRYKKLYCNLEN